jgi:hypothetical protein
MNDDNVLKGLLIMLLLTSAPVIVVAVEDR